MTKQGDDGSMQWPRKWLYILALVGGMAWGIWYIWKVSAV